MKGFGAVGVVVLSACVAYAETFDWAVEGTKRSYTMTENVHFATFDGISNSGGSDTTPNLYELHLNGYAFTWDNKPWCTSGNVLTDRSSYPNPTFRVIGPGTATGLMDFGGNGNGSANGLWLENGAVWDGGAINAYGATRIVVKDGSSLTWNSWGLQSVTGSEKGYFLVEGAGSVLRWKSGWTENYIHHNNSGLYLRDGAKAIGYIVKVGDKSHIYTGVAGDHSTIEVDDSTFLIESTFHLGGYHNPANNPTGDKTDVKYPTLRMKGAHATVAPTASGKLYFHLYDQIGARIEYEIPKDGFVDGEGAARVPFKATSLTVYPDRCEGRSFIADTVVSVKALDWMVMHPGEQMTLFEVATTPSGEEMEWLASKVSFDDFDPEIFEVPPSAAVSEDGKRLEITAAAGVHEEAFNPALTMTATLQAADAQRVSLKLVKFGALSQGITNLTLEVSKNADYSEATVIDLDPSSLAKEGDALTHDLTGLDLRSVYYVRASFVNDREKSGSCALTLATGGDVATFKFNTIEGGSWENAGNWTVGGNPATSWPIKGDKIGFAAHGNYTIYSSGSKDVSDISLGSSDYGAEPPTVYSFDLGGGSLKLSGSPRLGGGLVASKIDYLPLHPSLEILNGTFSADSGKAIAFGGTGSGGGGGVIIGRGGKWTSGRGDFNGSSRLIVRDGGVMTSDTSGFYWRSTASGYGFVMVTGAGSSYTAGGCFYANGENSGLIGHDGAEVKLNGGLTIGNYNQPYFGHGADHAFVEISNAFVRVKSTLKLGDIHEWHPDTQAGDKSDVKYPTLRFKGKSPVLTATDGQTLTFKVYDGLGGRVEFVVPEDGYETIPLQADSISWVERPEGDAYVNFGQTEFVVDGWAWCKAHPGESLTLVKLATPDKAGLERLIAKPTMVGRHTFPRDCLAVSEDGTEIVLSAHVPGMMLLVR